MINEAKIKEIERIKKFLNDRSVSRDDFKVIMKELITFFKDFKKTSTEEIASIGNEVSSLKQYVQTTITKGESNRTNFEKQVSSSLKTLESKIASVSKSSITQASIDTLTKLCNNLSLDIESMKSYIPTDTSVQIESTYRKLEQNQLAIQETLQAEIDALKEEIRRLTPSKGTFMGSGFNRGVADGLYAPIGSSGGTWYESEVLTRTDGTTYTLAHTPVSVVFLYLNGQKITKTTDYTISGATITMVSPTLASDILTATYN